MGVFAVSGACYIDIAADAVDYIELIDTTGQKAQEKEGQGAEDILDRAGGAVGTDRGCGGLGHLLLQ